MKTLVNEVWTQIAYHSDGHLVHTDKRSGKQTISFRVWPDIASANRTLAEGLGKIQWEDVDELCRKLIVCFPLLLSVCMRTKMTPRFSVISTRPSRKGSKAPCARSCAGTD